MKDTIEIDYSLDSIEEAAARLLQLKTTSKVYTFTGELGAGKTTFISKVCKQLSVSDVVNSPTFSIVQQYDYPHGNIYHMDLYRIKDEEEAANAGLIDCILSGDLCFVEWPENAPGIIPDDAVHSNIEITGAHSRKMRIQFRQPAI